MRGKRSRRRFEPNDSKELINPKRSENMHLRVKRSFENIKEGISRLSGLEIKSRGEIPAFTELLVGVLNSDRDMAILFSLDPERFITDLGVKLSPEIKRHLHEGVRKEHIDKKLYDEFFDGRHTFPEIRDIELDKTGKFFELPLFKEVEIEELRNINVDEMKCRDIAKFGRHLIPFFPERQDISGAELRPAVTTLEIPTETALETFYPKWLQGLLQKPSLSGWELVFQVREDFYKTLYDRYFAFQFLLAIFSKQAVGCVHEFTSWFLTFFRVNIVIEGLPVFTVENSTPNHASLKINFKSEVRTSSNGTTWSQPSNLAGSAFVKGPIEKKNSIVFSGITMPNCFISNLEKATIDLNITSGDKSLEKLVSAAFYDYFKSRLPYIPVSPKLTDSYPFKSFNKSKAWTFSALPGAGLDGISVCWGNGTEPYTNLLLLPDYNAVYGLSAAVFHYMIRDKLPKSAISQDDVTIHSTDIELRNGYIEIVSKGTYHTCSCLPNVNFTYSTKAYLLIDKQGKLALKADKGNVGTSGWWKIVIQLVLPIIGNIITAIIDSIAGSAIGGSASQFSLNEDIAGQFNNSAFPIPVSASFSSVQITTESVLFHGNLTVNM